MKHIAKITLLILFIYTSACTTSNKSEDDPPLMGQKHVLPQTSKAASFNVPYRSLDTSKKVTQFGFGSCNDQTQEQPLWKNILNQNPELFVMLGDNVYASTPETKPIYDQYLKLNENEDYKKVREAIPFLATWDDHDYGQNDGGADNPEKEEARKVFLNYWGYLRQTHSKNQQAIYHSRIIGSKNQRVQFILLDTRTDRSALVKNPDYNPQAEVQSGPPKIYLPTDDTKTQILSQDQWKWLEQELQKPAELRILISSIQLIPNDHYFEKWGNFPHERQKFFDLLKKLKTKNLVILSGDRHLSAISKYEIQKNQTIYEITASGLNRPSRNKEPEVDSTYTSPSFLKINYGLAQIDWTQKQVTFEIRDTEDKVQLSQTVLFGLK